jgi:hypothetical protein
LGRPSKRGEEVGTGRDLAPLDRHIEDHRLLGDQVGDSIGERIHGSVVSMNSCVQYGYGGEREREKERKGEKQE